jgi:hypothetical protein
MFMGVTKMDRYLGEYIKTLSEMKIRKIHEILDINRLDQESLKGFVQSAMRIPITSYSHPVQVKPRGVITSNKMVDDFSRLLTTCSEYEKVCDQVALTIDSVKEIHETTLKKIFLASCYLWISFWTNSPFCMVGTQVLHIAGATVLTMTCKKTP